MQELPERTQVVVVGAGPTGLTVAALLSQAEIPFVLVDELEEGLNTSRAAVVHAHTLEVLEQLDVVSELHAAGRVIPRFTVRDRDRVLLNVSFGQLQTRYAYALMIPQNVTEAILSRRMERSGGVVHRPFRALGIDVETNGIQVRIEDAAKNLRSVRARYLVGADGMRSTVREAAGIDFEGSTYEQCFVLADVQINESFPSDQVILFLSPAGPVVVAPLPGRRHRIVATMEDPPAEPGIEDVQRLLEERGPTRTVTRVESLEWSARFRVHHRLARGFRKGRFLLAGDAAHVHSPAGGQGMNLGIHDAIELGRALTAVLRGDAAESRLDRYARDRRAAAASVLTLTDRVTRVATVRGEAARSLRNSAIWMLGRIPMVRRGIASRLSQVPLRPLQAGATPQGDRSRPALGSTRLRSR